MLAKLARSEKLDARRLNATAPAQYGGASARRDAVYSEGYYSSWAQYTILLETREQRDRLKARLAAVGIPTMIYYPRGLHQQTAYAHMRFSDEWYPHTLAAVGRVLSLPMHPYLAKEDVDMVCEAILENLA